MLHVLIAIALFMHGAGHAVGFWMPVPAWFSFAWLLPGLGFVAGAWGHLAARRLVARGHRRIGRRLAAARAPDRRT